MIFVSLLIAAGAVAVGTVLIKLGIATVLVTVLSKLLTVALALIALLLSVLLYRSWRNRR